MFSYIRLYFIRWINKDTRFVVLSDVVGQTNKYHGTVVVIVADFYEKEMGKLILRKGEDPRKHSMHEKKAALFLLKLFINRHERCHKGLLTPPTHERNSFSSD